MSDRQFLYLCSALVLAFGLMLSAYSYNTREFVRGGYCQTTLPGHSDTAWMKCGVK